MNVDLKTEGMQLNEMTKRMIEQRTDALSRRLQRYGAGNRTLQAIFSKDDQGRIHSKLALELAGEVLHVSKSGPNAAHVIKNSMSALLRQTEKWRLQKNPNLKKNRGQRLDRLETIADFMDRTDDKSGELDEERLIDLYTSARRMALQETAYYQAIGNLEAAEIDPQDIVDTAIAEFIPKLRKPFKPHRIKQAIHERINELLADEVAVIESARSNQLSLEQRAPIHPNQDLSDLGDELLDFWIMDEELLLEDTIADPKGLTPDAIVEEKEGRRVLLSALLRLPPEHRYVFGAIVMDQQTPDDVSESLGRSMEEVSNLCETAKNKLISILSSPEIQLDAGQVTDIYASLATKFRPNIVGPGRDMH